MILGETDDGTDGRRECRREDDHGPDRPPASFAGSTARDLNAEEEGLIPRGAISLAVVAKASGRKRWSNIGFEHGPGQRRRQRQRARRWSCQPVCRDRKIDCNARMEIMYGCD
jgi:hypothetical protein